MRNFYPREETGVGGIQTGCKHPHTQDSQSYENDWLHNPAAQHK